MQFNVPQFIDMEDRIVGPLTAKQLGWLVLGGILLLILWNFLNTMIFIISAIFISLIVIALVFLKPHGLPLTHFVVASFSFISKPKIYIWKKDTKKLKLEKSSQKKIERKKIIKQKPDSDKIKNISSILDQ
jgi:membrane protein implicated in regulation of membrane protease activity